MEFFEKKQKSLDPQSGPKMCKLKGLGKATKKEKNWDEKIGQLRFLSVVNKFPISVVIKNNIFTFS